MPNMSDHNLEKPSLPWNAMELDDDEAEHRRSLNSDEAAASYVHFANQAAIMTSSGIGSTKEPLSLNQPKGLLALLLVRAAQQVRFACTGIALGYYSGAYSLLRSALETLSYLLLFDSDPHEIRVWFRNEFSTPPSHPDLVEPRSAQSKRARKALFSFEDDRSAKDAIEKFFRHANKRVHASVAGIAQEFGLDVHDLFPHDFEDLLDQSGQDFEKALDLALLTSHFAHDNEVIVADGAQDTVKVTCSCSYDETTVEDLSLFALYIGHRLLDFTADTFAISDEDFQKALKEWHRAMRRAL